MKITTIISTLNAMPSLATAVASFSAQTYADKELIVCDGASNDGTVEYLKSATGIHKWVSQPDAGIFDAWNRGIEQASGDWIHFLGADDLYADSSVFERVASRLNDVPSDSMIAYGDVVRVRGENIPVEQVGSAWNPERFRRIGMTIPHQGAFHRRELFEQHGTFDTSDRSTGTYEMLLRALAHGDATYLAGETVALMGVDGVSSHPKNQLRFINAYIDAQKKHGVFSRTPELYFRLLQANLKSAAFRILPERLALGLVDASRVLAGKRKLHT